MGFLLANRRRHREGPETRRKRGTALGQQIYGPGIDVQHGPSPKKRSRNVSGRKLVTDAGHSRTRQELVEKFEALLREPTAVNDQGACVEGADDVWEDVANFSPAGDDGVIGDADGCVAMSAEDMDVNFDDAPPRRPPQSAATQASLQSNYSAWLSLLPLLVEPLLLFTTSARAQSSDSSWEAACSEPDCLHAKKRILCLYWDSQFCCQLFLIRLTDSSFQ